MIFYAGKQAKTDSNLSKECTYISPWSMQIECFHRKIPEKEEVVSKKVKSRPQIAKLYVIREEG